MRAMLVPTGAMPRIIEVNGLEDLQAAVGGLIESCPWMFEDEPAVYVNEEGKLSCYPNRAIYATEEDKGFVKPDGSPVEPGDLLDIVFGDFVCVGFDPETGEDRDISDDEMAKVMQRFGTKRSIDSGFIETMLIKAAKEAQKKRPKSEREGPDIKR